MKRFRVLNMDFDTRADLVMVKIQDSWEAEVKELWRRKQSSVKAGLLTQYGALAFDQKIANLCDLGAAPFSIVAFHNAFYRQARDAFIIGAYYPALTAICALGERILNHMILLFRDDFRGTPEYKHVYRKDSFDKWDVAIETLVSWRVLLVETGEAFNDLWAIRNRSLHFNPETEDDTRGEALAAARAFQAVLERQFTAFATRPWYIPNDFGISFVRKGFETDPFVAKVVLPNCALVGPAHELERDAVGRWIAIDPEDYPEVEISDEEYIEAFKERHARGAG